MSKCAACGLPGHRYGRNEGMDRFDPMACINSLRAQLEDPVAVVRRGVESGTIKGEVKRWCETHQAESIENHDGPSDECWRVVWADHDADEGLPLTGYGLCRIVERLVIPVSDGSDE